MPAWAAFNPISRAERVAAALASPEAAARAKFSSDFYSGQIQNPLPYLAANHIAAVLIWPEDQIPDHVLAQLRKELMPDYVYVDCKMGQPDNAGLFLRK